MIHTVVLACAQVMAAIDILQPPSAVEAFHEIYVMCELMQSDLHRIIVSPQGLSADHVKIFLYQILRGTHYLHSAKIVHRCVLSSASSFLLPLLLLPPFSFHFSFSLSSCSTCVSVGHIAFDSLHSFTCSPETYN